MDSRLLPRLVVVLCLISSGCNMLPPSDTSETSPSPTPSDIGTPSPTGVPYELAIDNGGNNVSYDVSVVIAQDWGNNSIVYNDTITVPPDAYVTENITFPETGPYAVVVAVDGSSERTHPYTVRSSNPDTAVVIWIQDDGTVQIATFHT